MVFAISVAALGALRVKSHNAIIECYCGQVSRKINSVLFTFDDDVTSRVRSTQNQNRSNWRAERWISGNKYMGMLANASRKSKE